MQSRATTTGDVAKIIEARYGLFSGFAKAKDKLTKDEIANSVQVALQSLLSGQSVPPFDRGLSKIESAFKDFISSREAESVGLPGTPTAAAERGVNHRLRHPYAKSNPRRPSFRDTGLMRSSLKAWMSREK